ncbi:hypothetical protein KUV86_15750 [Halomonas sp. DP8Y7-3]|uniref:hypothetical protein n=1 Tax=Halomonas sp. DP8Y7-3 TaxID=2859079 RepID=UPI001C97CAB5|nr:hypothetical protein [Halomonas sp. DP8Y7-3]MBY5930566.1 hypothetical protein [Halomonas sp. DP8Y7-3]
MAPLHRSGAIFFAKVFFAKVFFAKVFFAKVFFSKVWRRPRQGWESVPAAERALRQE